MAMGAKSVTKVFKRFFTTINFIFESFENNNNLKRKLYNCRIQGQSLSNQGCAEYLHRQRVGGERETSGRVGQVVQSENRRVEEL